MKKKEFRLSIIIGCLFVLFTMFSSFVFSGTKVFAHEETGHDDFTKIKFVDGEHRLINDYTGSEIKNLYKKVGKKAFGWVTHYLEMDEKIEYDGLVIFSRSNKTSKNMSFEYYLKETTTVKTDVTINGSVSGKIAGTIKKINTTLSGELKGEVEKSNSHTDTTDSKTTINIVIYPKTKVTMIQTGEAYVTSGVSKYYFFGIVFKKGIWERIDVETTYYELREEIIS